jgi:hypothetical protein
MIDLTKYRPRAEYQVYPEEYFSGCECSVYFGDVWVDEILSINFSLLEYVQPVFGYNSYTYDACARGARLIQGNFRINFRESFYLHKIIEDSKIIEGKKETWATHSADRVEADEAVLSAYYNNIINSADAKEIVEQLKNKSTEDKLKIAKQFQDLMWDKKTNPGSASGEVFFKHPERGFTVVILYGSHFDLPSNPEYTRKFDVPASTSITLSGVQLTGVSHVVTPDGQPVYEDYSFIARDMETKR